MSNFRMTYWGGAEGREVIFVCQRCVNPQCSEPSFDTYNRPYKADHPEPGACTCCAGTGFDPEPGAHGIVCRECDGTGRCPECLGQPYREWNELPGDMRSAFADARDLFELSGSSNYTNLTKFYRNY